MIRAEIGFTVDDLTTIDVGEFLKASQSILTAQDDSAPAGTAWQLDLTKCRYLGPTAAALIASMKLMGVHKGQTSTLLLPSFPPPLAAFCKFSGLLQVAQTGIIAAPANADHPKNETAPLGQFRRMNWGGSRPLIQLVKRHFPAMSDESEELIGVCYSEIAQNIEDHAASPIGGVICARYIAKHRELRIAVVDRGIGIADKLRRSPPKSGERITSDEHALRLVLRGNVSSKSRPNNQGQGISNLALIARGNRGHLVVVSNGAMAVAACDKPDRFETLSHGLRGTAILLSMTVAANDRDPGR